jgi:hypothetical protein
MSQFTTISGLFAGCSRRSNNSSFFLLFLLTIVKTSVLLGCREVRGRQRMFSVEVETKSGERWFYSGIHGSPLVCQPGRTATPRFVAREIKAHTLKEFIAEVVRPPLKLIRCK